MSDGWYTASLAELGALLDELGEKGEVTIRPGDAAVGAIIGTIGAATVFHQVGLYLQAAHKGYEALDASL